MRDRPLVFALTGAVTIALVALGMYLSARGGGGDTAGYLLKATYDQADGVSAGSPVYLAGVRVGVVERMTLNSRTLKPTVTMRIRDHIAIPEESAAMIMSDGVLGEKYIKIEPGSGDETMAKGSEFDLVQDAVIVEELLQRIVQSAEALRKSSARKN